ncbi:MAG TPA: TonB-dependent receptor [Hanamia sp.]|nr:TonB-dependent receptor [Hanamia sp.]
MQSSAHFTLTRLKLKQKAGWNFSTQMLLVGKWKELKKNFYFIFRKQNWLVMKLTAILLLSACLQVSATGFSQNITLSEKNVTLQKVFKQIHKQTGYQFFYEDEMLDKVGRISINVKDAPLEKVLAICFKDAPFTYSVENNAITVRPKNVDVVLQPQLLAINNIHGTIKDDKGNPLVGVSVIVKGTTKGTSTNTNGSFSIDANAGDVLEFSFVGYQKKSIRVGNNTDINVVMEIEAMIGNEVVVVGYGTQKKADLTGSVSTVDFDKQSMASRAISNVSTALAGLASGIRVRQDNGLPSDDNIADLSIRGVGSLNISSAPLVVIDGVVGNINSISPNDVASVSVLKDAASAAIYGSRASNGVILITSKTGKGMNGKVNFSYDNYVGSKSPTLLPDWVNNTIDYMKLNNMVQVNSGQAPWYSDDEIAEWQKGMVTDPISYPSTNWWKAITQRDVVQNHSISARGGSEKVNFYTAMDYYKDEGMIPNSAFHRLNFLNNLSYKVNNWLKLGSKVSYISSKADPVEVDDIFTWFRALNPAMVPQLPDGRYGGAQLENQTSNNNPLRIAQQERGEANGNRFQGQIFGVVTPLQGLSITARYSTDIFQQLSWSGSEPTDIWDFKADAIVSNNSGNTKILTNSFAKNERQVIDLFADYTKAVGKNHGHLLVGYNQEYYKSQGFSGTRQDLLSYQTPVLDAATGEITNLTGSASDYALRSFFGRLNYDYDGKYLLQADLRYDGSSKFAPDHRWGLFPSASAGWMISRENFFQPLQTVFTNFKLRASYGELGNNGIGNYDWQNFYSVVKYPFNETAVSALVFNAFGNPTITWESTAITNIGIDTRLFDKLDLTLNYYNKLTKNILANSPIPGTNGGITAPRVNSARVRNSGFEADARYGQRLGKLNVSASLNFAYNKNRIVSYKGDFIEPHGQNAGAWTEGYPIGVFWVREVDHIIQTQKEVDDLVAQGYTFSPGTPGPGDFLYKDVNRDKKIDDNDRVLTGNPIPLYTYGGSITLNYAGIDFSVYFDGVGKWDRYVNSAVYALSHNITGYEYPVSYLNMWSPTNTHTNIPKVYAANQVNNQVSNFFLYKAGYLKIRSLQLGYSLPGNIIRRLKLNKVRLFVNLENYFTLTKWPYLDPEMEPSTNDDASYPLGKIASAGLQVSF